MPDNARFSELLAQLQEYVEQLRTPGGPPPQTVLPRAIGVIAELMAIIETPTLGIENLWQDLDTLRKTVQAQGADLALTQEKMATLADQLEGLVRAIVEKIDAKAAQKLIADGLQPHLQTLETLAQRIAALEQALLGETPLTEATARQLIEEALNPIRNDIRQLQQYSDPRIADLLQRVALIENQLANPGGLTETQVLLLIKRELGPIQQNIAALHSDYQQQILQKLPIGTFEAFKTQTQEQLDSKASQTDLNAIHQALSQKANQTDLDAFKIQTQEQLDGKASQTDLNAIHQALSQKANQTDLDAFKIQTQQQIDGKASQTDLDTIHQALSQKANQTDLDAFKTQTQQQLDGKASQTDLNATLQALSQKANQTDLDAFKTQTQQQLDGKASQTDLDTIHQALSQKAEQTDLDAFKDEVQEALGEKATKAELAECKAEITAALEKKADKATVEEILQTLEGLELNCCERPNAAGARLARIALQGWGIVGGFDIRSDQKHYVHITPGIGITPQGALVLEPRQDNTGLVSSGECDEEDVISGALVFSHYRPFTYKGDCLHFQHNFEDCPIWELLPPGDNLPDHALPLTPQNQIEQEQPFIADKIILLLPDGDKHHYLLIRREDLLKKLALNHKCKSKNPNADYIFEEEYSPEDDMLSDKALWLCLHPAYGLPELSLYRFGFYQDKDCAPEDLDTTDFPKICHLDDLYQTWKPIVEEAIQHLHKAMGLLIERYRPVLFPLFNSQIYIKKRDLLMEKWVRFVKYNDTLPAGDKGVKYYAQYFYDWARDLMAAYHELRDALTELMNDLRPLTLEMLELERCFLMLGPAYHPTACYERPPLRDYFQQPPIFNGNAARLDACKLYFCRLFAMIEGFYLEGYLPNADPPGWCKPEKDAEEIPVMPDFSRLRITPGRSYFYPLSEQSIPFYYPLNDNSKSLQYFWNYRRFKTLSTDRLLSYHATDAPPDFPSYSRRRSTLRPLYYALDAYDFYRIEGLIGKKSTPIYYKAPAGPGDPLPEFPVFEALVFLVQKHNLDFDVVQVRVDALQDLPCPKDDYQYLYALGDTDDLRLRAWSLGQALLGAEHLAGVPKGGTFILVTDADGCAIADFSLPYRCCKAVAEWADKAYSPQQPVQTPVREIVPPSPSTPARTSARKK
jgi:hypothetical protein